MTVGPVSTLADPQGCRKIREQVPPARWIRWTAPVRRHRNRARREMRTRIFFLTSVAVAGMAMTAIATPAKAATAQERHCVIDVSTPNAPASCYQTFTEAIAKATGGRVTEAPNDPAAAVKDLAARLNTSVDKASGAGP